MEIGRELEVSTLGQKVSIIELMDEEEKKDILEFIKRRDVYKRAKKHDDQVLDFPDDLTIEEIVNLVREVRAKSFKSIFIN
jgi:hypothetical protein